MVHTWRTKKVEGGFEWSVSTIEYNKPSVTLKSGRRATRAQAAGIAKKWLRYINAQVA